MLYRTLLALAMILFTMAPARAETERFFEPTEGFVQAKDLPEDFKAAVRSVQLSVKDAFEGSTVHSDAEKWFFDVGNRLHIESRQGTIRRRLYFHEGDTITKGLLLETEKALRGEEFLADAIIEVKKWEDGTAHVIVTTYDQWTTVPGVSLQFKDNELIYWVGPVESNFLGTGQRIGFFLGHDQIRDTRWIDYNNNALFPQRLRLGAHVAWLSDGYSVFTSLSKPLETRSDRYSFSASVSSVELSEAVYFDNNQLDRLPAGLADALAGRYSVRQLFRHVDTHDFDFSATRSYGYHTKFNVSGTFDRRDRYNHGDTLGSDTLMKYVPIPVSGQVPDERTDDLIGLNLSMYQYDYKTVHNFRNLKWGETLETGWRLSTKAAINQKWLGARNGDFYLNHTLVYNNAWWDALFFNSNGSMHYFVSPQGDFDDGYVTAFGEMQWKPVYVTSTYLSASWSSLFAAEKAQQLLLGVDEGLNGYPSFYFAGQARVLFEAEQRFFTPFEIGTLVPALALFANAGNTFTAWDKFDPRDLHYAIGFGLRLGASKSVQKVVNHLNLTWPVGDKYLTGPVFALIAKKSL
jgi:hypothetical protein